MTTVRSGEGAEELFRRRAMSTGLPTETRRAPGRAASQWLVAILLVVVSVTAAAWLYVQKGDTTEVLVIARDVPAGHEIQAEDLGTAQVSGVRSAVTADDASTVIGQYTAVGMVAGQVLSHDAVTAQTLPLPGEKMVAVNVATGRLPSGVKPGSAVEVLAAPAPGEGMSPQQLAAPQVLTTRATVHSVEVVDDGTVVLTLRLSDVDADVVATHSAAGAVALIQVPVGE